MAHVGSEILDHELCNLIRADCHAHRVDWRARAIAAEALVASYESPTCDHRHPCRCGSGGHPRWCMRHPKGFV